MEETGVGGRERERERRDERKIKGQRKEDETGGRENRKGRPGTGGTAKRQKRRLDYTSPAARPAYLAAIGFSLPKASVGFIRNCTFSDPPKTA